MRRSITTLVLVGALAIVLAAGTFSAAPPAVAQDIDAQVPPGNPVIGDDRPGDIQAGSDTNYAMWGLVAVCLIGAGVLLVKVEKWEARRIEHQVP